MGLVSLNKKKKDGRDNFSVQRNEEIQVIFHKSMNLLMSSILNNNNNNNNKRIKIKSRIYTPQTNLWA